MAEKQNTTERYYRAYRDYQNELSDVKEYSNLLDALKKSSTEQDKFSGDIAVREIDMEWVLAIEHALPYIDKAIREQRRFIKQTDEVVPIEKSKKITTESVRHLAQHTNLIGRVEGDRVTPKSILNIQREENFEIYENRFLRTLIIRAADFVGNCYADMKNKPNTAAANITMLREAYSDDQALGIAVRCKLSYLQPDNNFSINQDVSSLSEFERVLRLRIILSDFLNTPLMKDLSGSAEVRNPITRTNLLTKDTNFREVLALWEFLDSYHKTGFKLITNKLEEGPIGNEMQDGIYDAFSMLQFVIKLNMSSEYKASLEETYQNENARRAQAQEQNIQDRITNALETTIQQHQAELTKLKEAHTAELNQLNEAHTAELNQLNEAHTAELNQLNEAHTAKLTELKETHTAEIARVSAECEEKIEAQKNACEAALTTLKNEHKAILTSQKKEYEAALSTQKNAYEEKLKALSAELTRELENQKSEIAKLTKSYNTELAKFTEAHNAEIAKLINSRDQSIAEGIAKEKLILDSAYKDEAAKKEKNWKKTLEKETKKYQRTILKLEMKNDKNEIKIRRLEKWNRILRNLCRSH